MQGLAVAPLGTDAYVVSITVPGKGAEGCYAPTFVGFEPINSTLVAKISRAPFQGTCAIVDAITFYVALNRISIPAGITAMAVSESCPKPGCREQPVPIPSS